MGEGEFCFVIVDDSASSRKLTMDILVGEFPDSSFYQFADGLEARKWMLANPAHDLIVITDLEMPNLDGIGLVKFMKWDSKFQDVPIVMISGFSRIEEIAKGWGCRFLQKPFHVEDFLKIISEFTKEK